ncbi:hypothetical protein HDV63DRAFT_210407 [Trichoderma sp. SZMC 28014]
MGTYTEHNRVNRDVFEVCIIEIVFDFWVFFSLACLSDWDSNLAETNDTTYKLGFIEILWMQTVLASLIILFSI